MKPVFEKRPTDFASKSTHLGFNLNWRLTVCSLVLFPILIGLGLWQLNRADEKQGLMDAWKRQRAATSQSVMQFKGNTFPAYQPVTFLAYYLPEHYWLLEAKMYQGRPGYEVLMAAELAFAELGPEEQKNIESTERILVNRGWVPADPDRRKLPLIETPTTAVQMYGELRNQSDTALIDESKNSLLSWPHRVLEIKLDVMSAQLGKPLSHIVALDATDPSAFVVQSTPINMPPEKHRGYAVQWFSLAAALLLLWFVSNTNVMAMINRKK